MKARINRWLAPPVFEGDEEKTWRASLLNATTIVIIISIVVVFIGNLIGGRIPTTVLIINVTVFTGILILRLLLFNGKVALVGTAITVFGIILVTAGAVSLGTIRTPTTAILILIIIISGFLFGKKGLVFTTISSSLAVLGLILAENAGMLPRPDYTVNITQWITYTALFGLTGVLTYYSCQFTHRALKRAFKESADRKRAEEVFRESQQEYQSLFENSPISLWVEDFSEVKKYIDNLRDSGVEDFREYFENNRKDVEKCASLVRVVDVNRTTLELYKAESKEDFFKGLSVVFDEDSYDAFREQLIVVSEGKTSYEGEAINMTLTGEKEYITLKWTVAPGSEETYSKVFVSIIDITDRKQAEEALKKSEDKYRSLVKNIDDIIYVVDEKGKIKYINDAFERTTDYKIYELIDKDYMDIIVPESHKYAAEIFKRQLAGEDVGVFELSFYNKKGQIQILEIREKLIFEGNRVVEVHGIGRDITERKQAEEMLKESEEKYKDLFENANDLIQSVTPDGSFVYVNRAWWETLGYSEEEIPGLSLFDIIHPDSKEHCMEMFQRVMSGEKVENIEAIFVSKDGRKVVVEGSVNCRFKDNKPDSTRGIFRDITDRKRAEEALYSSEERFKSLSNASFEAIFISEKGACIDQNKTAEKMFGYNNSEAVGMQGAEWIVSEDHERVMSNMLSGYEEPYEVTALRKDGTTFPAEIQARMAYFQNRQVRITALKDITIRKQTEEALRESEDRYGEVVENIADIIYILDGEGKFVFVNNALERFFGYRLDDILKKSFRNFITPKSYEYTKKIFRRMLDGEDVGEFEIEFYDKERNIRIIETRIQLVWDGNRVVGLHGIGRDITERKKLEEQLIRAQKMEALGTLTGGIAHDFNNILSTVLGYASFLKSKAKKGDPFYNGLDAIEKSSLRASDLTAQLLAYTRRGKLEVKPININRIVKEVYDLITKTFDKSIKIEIETDSNLKIVEGDESQLTQVVMNIAVNAQSAMPKGGTFEIETYMEKVKEKIEKVYFDLEPGNYVCMKFTDAGIGMDKETLKRIFEPYFTTMGDKGGTGLGMSVVFGIVKGHDGYIDIESKLGEGTEIVVYLPASKKKEEIMEKEIGEKLGGTETILIIDDEKSILKMTKDLLEESGYSVYTANSGKTGLRAFKTKNIDIVILDIKMPEMDGGEVLEKLLKIDSKVKILLSSGFSEEDQHHGLIEMGAMGFIGKPFMVDKLLAKIREVLN